MTSAVKKSNRLCFLLTVFVLFAVSVTCYFISHPKVRYTVEFSQIGSGESVTEIRWLAGDPVQGEVRTYVEEVLLGPSVQRTRPLFSRGTRADFCFMRGHTLYLGLTIEAIYQDSEAESFSRGMELLEKNIKKNFPSVRKIEFFVDGNEVRASEKSDEKSK